MSKLRENVVIKEESEKPPLNPKFIDCVVSGQSTGPPLRNT